ncbi:hypothetical protein N658DRAFT_62211 [Parathielavia hyrcaniae]|uniref:Uncharacterized protein n=1 Tax=Parathielavia hyrcaniae TaxID=113614 RepID=A0AAN6Q2A4_9PEZI|nr:hypothetical protein N658DRAFT_62211 [Parathielavia hyrcaniae]
MSPNSTPSKPYHLPHDRSRSSCDPWAQEVSVNGTSERATLDLNQEQKAVQEYPHSGDQSWYRTTIVHIRSDDNCTSGPQPSIEAVFCYGRDRDIAASLPTRESSPPDRHHVGYGTLAQYIYTRPNTWGRIRLARLPPRPRLHGVGESTVTGMGSISSNHGRFGSQHGRKRKGPAQLPSCHVPFPVYPASRRIDETKRTLLIGLPPRRHTHTQSP